MLTASLLKVDLINSHSYLIISLSLSFYPWVMHYFLGGV